MNSTLLNHSTRAKLLKCAVSNTGPMLSVFQSDQSELIKALYDRIYIPTTTLFEYKNHGAGVLIQELVDNGFVIVCELSEAEKKTARRISEEIAHHSLSKDKKPEGHYPEAEAMVLINRAELEAVKFSWTNERPKSSRLCSTAS